MPFQAIPIAMRSSPGSAAAKLVLIYLTDKTEIEEGSSSIDFELAPLAAFAQVSRQEAVAALHILERQGRIEYLHELEHAGSELFSASVVLPLSWREPEDRKRIKATPDQIDAILEHSGGHCVGCGIRGEDVDWHVDHIIPRSIGGADVEANCQALCGRCNSRKGARVHWIDFLGGRR